MLAYCDYIAHVIQKDLRNDSYKEDSLLNYVDSIKWDLDENGAFKSTAKSIEVEDKNKKRYKITVEEL